jgi:predicted nucleotidyltransferase
MNPNDPNLRLVEGVVKHLGDLREQFVFVGGCATGLLITDPARPPVRATTDVDLVTEVVTRAEYYEIAERLRELGFAEDAQSDVICRWRIGGFQVDVMPTDQTILGFTNRWHQAAADTAIDFELPSGAKIKLISPPSFLATKLEAFHDRGDQDYSVSHDIEDIITVVDGRPEIVNEITEDRTEIRDYLREEMEILLAEELFTESISWHLAGDQANQQRVPIIIQRLRTIAEL